eukprot:365470-Chlamydomonas_euryale.AAC.6
MKAEGQEAHMHGAAPPLQSEALGSVPGHATPLLGVAQPCSSAPGAGWLGGTRIGGRVAWRNWSALGDAGYGWACSVDAHADAHMGVHTMRTSCSWQQPAERCRARTGWVTPGRPAPPRAAEPHRWRMKLFHAKAAPGAGPRSGWVRLGKAPWSATERTSSGAVFGGDWLRWHIPSAQPRKTRACPTAHMATTSTWLPYDP